MKWALLGVRLGTIAVSIVIAIIIILSILPLAMGGLDVDIPETQESSWTLQDDVFSFSQPIRVNNGGYYDIEDFSVSFEISDDMGNKITDYVNTPVDLTAGETTQFNVMLRIDLDDISNEAISNMVFNGTTFDTEVEIEAQYMMKLMKMSVNASEQMDWSPLIQDYGVENVYHTSNDSAITLHAPYYISASDMLNGQSITVDCVLSNSTSIIGESSETITLSQYTTGEFLFPLSEQTSQFMLNNSQSLTLDMTVGFHGVEQQMTFDYYWEAPGGMP